MSKHPCWYCHAETVEVWRVEDEEHDWPMCSNCSGAVRKALALRAEGYEAEADAVDEQSGICTNPRKCCGAWIPPVAVSRAA